MSYYIYRWFAEKFLCLELTAVWGLSYFECFSCPFSFMFDTRHCVSLH
jgi:hypothetical protein